MEKGTMLRLSKNFLLLDFLYDQSMMDGVVWNGDCIREKIAEITDDSEVFLEGRFLCESILDRIVKRHGPVSIAAGLWFKELPGQSGAHDSKSGVHRWKQDTGAAADLVVHSWVNECKSPTRFVENLSIDDIKWHRARSYEGSEFCCLASRSRGNDPTGPSRGCREKNPWRRPPYTICSPGKKSRATRGCEERMRRAESFWCDDSSSGSGSNTARSVVYSRYNGKIPPLWDHSIVEVPRDALESSAEAEVGRKVVRPWHVRVSDFFVLLDFCRNEMMFDTENLSRAKPLVTVPPLTFRTANTVIKTARMFGEVLDPIKECLGSISVVRGMEPRGFSDTPDADEHRWIPGEGKCHSIEFVTPKRPNLDFRGLREMLLKDRRRIVDCNRVDGPDFEGNRIRVTIRDFDPSHHRTSADGEEYPWTE